MDDIANIRSALDSLQAKLKPVAGPKIKLSEFQMIVFQALHDMGAVRAEDMEKFKAERARISLVSHEEGIITKFPKLMIALEPRLVACSAYPIYTIEYRHDYDDLIIGTHIMYKNMVPIELQEQCEITKFKLYDG